MKRTDLPDRIILRADKGMALKFKNKKQLYAEISIKRENEKEIENIVEVLR